MFRVAPAFLLISVLLETGVEAFYTPPDPFQAGSGAYPLVTVIDSTEYNVINGKVDYASVFCKNDDYSVTPSTKWSAKHRGVCLVCHVTATVKTPGGDIPATSYSASPCTSYSHFAVISDGNGGFQVTRVVT